MPTKVKHEINKIYLEHQSQSVGQAHSRTFPILQFLITINLAYFGALWVLGEQGDIWIWNEGRDIITGLMLIINLSFATIFVRETHINRILRDELYCILINLYGDDETKGLRDRIMNKDGMPRWTGRILTGLFIWMASIPATYFILLHYFCCAAIKKSQLLFLISIATTLLLTWLITTLVVERKV